MSMYQKCSACCRIECVCGDSALEEDFEPSAKMATNERLARFMGWVELPGGLWHPERLTMRYPRYDSDLNAMAEVEAELERRGLHERYALCVIAMSPGMDTWTWTLARKWFALLHAPASVRAEAAVRVIPEAAGE